MGQDRGSVPEGRGDRRRQEGVGVGAPPDPQGGWGGEYSLPGQFMKPILFSEGLD